MYFLKVEVNHKSYGTHLDEVAKKMSALEEKAAAFQTPRSAAEAGEVATMIDSIIDVAFNLSQAACSDWLFLGGRHDG